MRLWHPAFRVCHHNKPMMFTCEGTSQADLWTADIPSLDGSWGNHWPLTWVSSHFSHPFVGLWDPVEWARKYRLRKARGRGTMWLWGGHRLCEDLQCGYFGITNVLVLTMLYKEAQWAHWLEMIISKDEFIESSSLLSLGPEEGKEILFKLLQGKDFSDIRVLPLPNNPRIVAKPWTSLWRTGIQTIWQVVRSTGTCSYDRLQLPIWFCNVISE